jgi:hypothetical protein
MPQASPVGGEKQIEQQSAHEAPAAGQAKPEEPSVPSDTSDGSAATGGEKHSVEELRGWLTQGESEERRGLWRKVINFVQGK